MQSVSSRIWTRVAVFISYNDNNYTTGTSTENITILYILSDDFLQAFLEVAEQYSNILCRNKFIMTT